MAGVKLYAAASIWQYGVHGHCYTESLQTSGRYDYALDSLSEQVAACWRAAGVDVFLGECHAGAAA